MNALTSNVPLVHTSAFALVPADEVWEPIQSLRSKYRDAGLFRWPPHVNLIYPFVLPKNYGVMSDTLSTLSVDSFEVTFTSSDVGVFGGEDRGVLWLRPESNGKIESLQDEIVKALKLPNQKPKRPFVPHLTISHFASRQEAEDARDEILSGSSPFQPITFQCDRLAMLQRNGDSGQFFCNREFLLDGGDAREMPYHYPNMPTEEFDWLPRVRGALNTRRKRNKKKRRSNNQNNNNGPPT